MNDLPTFEEFLAATGEDRPFKVDCPHCGQPRRPFEIVDTSPVDSLAPLWMCAADIAEARRHSLPAQVPSDEDFFASIEAGAAAARRRLRGDLFGQGRAYDEKAREAQIWSPLADQADFPYLTEEATRKGRPIAAIVAEVRAKAARDRRIDPRIEGARTAAKEAVAAAVTLDDKRAAAIVDWGALFE